ncbi:hypothetical protein VTK73DRAFT_1599 [Phialemonium thermophilum]|uniref:Methyltransferase type 11 domain-containing protein n=1 Tax=Phialemonium thermophilum TaxID=223376 RepID=A0ABR3Y4F5_9PEZI
MSSLRSGSKPRSGLADEKRRRMDGYADPTYKEVTPSVYARRTKTEPDNGHTTSQSISQTKASSRIPQSSSHIRYPPFPPNSDRSAVNQQQQSGTSAGSISSGRSLSHLTGSSTSSPRRLPTPTSGSSTRKALRRKNSGLSNETGSIGVESRSGSHRTSSSSSMPRSQTSQDASSGAQFDRGLTESPMEIRMAQKVDLPRQTAQTVTVYPELDRYRDVNSLAVAGSSVVELPYRLTTQDLPPPTPLFSGTSSQMSGSPSTRFSESPGPGPYSRDTTPTSMSSQSPSLAAPLRPPVSKSRQISPIHHTRPPITRRRTGSVSNEGESSGTEPQGLAAVRESLTSSSSNSTVRDVEKKEKKAKKRLSPLPPSPPPRKSSQKFPRARDEKNPPVQPSRRTAQLAERPQPPARTSALTSGATNPPSSQKPSAPPVRPSRDGTPDLHSQLSLPMPVVHSNISSASLSERRRSSVSAQGSQLPRSVATSPLGRRLAQPRLPSGGRESPLASQTSVSDTEGHSRIPAQTGARQTPSPGVSTFKSRFTLFSRKPKAPSDAPQPEKEKATRKGPAAGTGHEGYGRLGAPRRRSGSVSNLVRGVPTLSSQESLASSQPQDSFLQDRMAPVVISGGSVVENRNLGSELVRTESNQSVSAGWTAAGSKNSSQVSLSSKDAPRHTLWPSAIPREPTHSMSSFGSRRPSDSSDSEALAMKSTLAFRRSMQRLKSGADHQQQPKTPKPIVTRPQVVSPSMTSLDTSVLSDDSSYGPDLYTGRWRKGSASSTKSAAPPKKLTKRARSPRKWNLFGRSQSQPAGPEVTTLVPATVEVVQSKPVPFYAMMDSSEQEDTDLPDLEQVLREARAADGGMPPFREPSGEASPLAAGRDLVGDTKMSPALSHQRHVSAEEGGQSAPRAFALASPALRTYSEPDNTASNPVATPGRIGTGRPSRLLQVGRIPKVVNSRQEQTSPRSFSRPFNRISTQVSASSADVVDTDSVAKGGPTPPQQSTPDLTNDETTVTGCTDLSAASSERRSKIITLDPLQTGREFLSFSPRKNSEGTVTTSSGSSGIQSFAGATAVVPQPNAPLVEDEIWDEYDDLLGEEEALKVPPSAGSSLGKPFHLEDYSDKLRKEFEQPLESPTVRIKPPSNDDEGALHGLERPVSSVYDDVPATKPRDVTSLGTDPTTPFSVTEFVSGYGDRNNSVSSVNQPDTSLGKKSSDHRDSHESRRSNASSTSQGSDDSSPLSQVNLRVGSMTVSKWLTFGHVIFSPVREDLTAATGSEKRHSILVIDGLGNDDWSFYAAETYPSATFYNMSPRAPLPTEHQPSSSFPLSPRNHHQIQYMSHADKFPFGPQSFTSLVFRFPAAAPEYHYRNVISEARRVLKPGGYIELSILDVDLNNMGSRGRRSVRRLKERIHAKSPDTWLGSTADLILRLLGSKGFTDIKTCRVGVPVASLIAHTSSASESNGPSSLHGSGTGTQSTVSTGSRSTKKKDGRSLAEMMSDDSPVADENITKMVAKVGRWWYNRCYESVAVGVPGLSGSSVWNDRSLLAECEQWGTSLKLMVCHARVPDGRGRVASI